MKQKCRENRKSRKKRDRKLLARLVGKRFDRLVLKAEGKSPAYYEVRYANVRTMLRAGRRAFDLRKIRYAVLPRAALRELYVTLAAMTPPGLTVTIPRGGDAMTTPVNLAPQGGQHLPAGPNKTCADCGRVAPASTLALLGARLLCFGCYEDARGTREHDQP